MTKAETKTLLQLSEEVPDHRVGNAIKHSLRDILFLGMLAVCALVLTLTMVSFAWDDGSTSMRIMINPSFSGWSSHSDYSATPVFAVSITLFLFGI